MIGVTFSCHNPTRGPRKCRVVFFILPSLSPSLFRYDARESPLDFSSASIACVFLLPASRRSPAYTRDVPTTRGAPSTTMELEAPPPHRIASCRPPFRMKGEKSRGASRRYCVTCRCGSVCGRQRRHGDANAVVSLSLNYSLTRASRDGRGESENEGGRG